MQIALFDRSVPFFTCTNCSRVKNDGVILLLSSGIGRWSKIARSPADEIEGRSAPATALSEPAPSPLFITVTKPTAGRSAQDHDEVRRQCILASIIGFTAPLIAAYVFSGM